MRVLGAVALLLADAGLHASAFSVSPLAGSSGAVGPALAARARGAASLAVRPARASVRRIVSPHMQGAKLDKTSTAKDVLEYFSADLSGKTAIVTGANSGIGLETCKALASVGCRVIMACRNAEAGREAVESEIKTLGEGGYAVPNPDVTVMELDLNDLLSVEKFAEEV